MNHISTLWLVIAKRSILDINPINVPISLNLNFYKCSSFPQTFINRNFCQTKASINVSTFWWKFALAAKFTLTWTLCFFMDLRVTNLKNFICGFYDSTNKLNSILVQHVQVTLFWFYSTAHCSVWKMKSEIDCNSENTCQYNFVCIPSKLYAEKQATTSFPTACCVFMLSLDMIRDAFLLQAPCINSHFCVSAFLTNTPWSTKKGCHEIVFRLSMKIILYRIEKKSLKVESRWLSSFLFFVEHRRQWWLKTINFIIAKTEQRSMPKHNILKFWTNEAYSTFTTVSIKVTIQYSKGLSRMTILFPVCTFSLTLF